MDEKKHPGRFTIAFNLDDERQRVASEELRRHGRRKARFLADAIFQYTHGQGSQNASAVDEATLMRCVNAFMERMQGGMTIDVPIRTPEQVKPAEAPESPPWSREDLSVIADTLSAFQK